MKTLKTSIISLVLTVVFTVNLCAQGLYTLENTVPGGANYGDLTLEAYHTFRFKGDELILVTYNNLFKFKDNKVLNKDVFFKTDNIIKLTKKRDISVSQMRYINVGEKSYGLIAADNELFFLDLEKKKKFLHFKKEKDYRRMQFSPANLHYAFTVENDLYILDKDNVKTKVAEAENENVYCGYTAYDSEFSQYNYKGIFWSPDGNYLAFYKIDETTVSDYPILESIKDEGLNTKVPIPGGRLPEVGIGIYNMATKKTIYLNTGDVSNKYLTNLSWSPSGKYIYVAELNRAQNHLELNEYSVETGEKTLTLFEENSDKYINPVYDLVFLKSNPEQFIWQSKRDGHKHLYLYNTSGELIKQLTSGDWDILSVLDTYSDGNVYYTSNESNTINQDIYMVNVNTGNKMKLNSESGVRLIQRSESGDYILDEYSDTINVRKIDLLNIKDKTILEIQSMKDPRNGFPSPNVKLGKIKAADGVTDLNYRLMLPSALDPNKKYPVIINTSGEVCNSWLGYAKEWELFFSQEGFIVFTIDFRGFDNFRGLDFNTASYGQLGVAETADIMEGVKFLQSLDYIDAEKIGIYGEDYNGFLSMNMMLKYPDVIKTGVAVTPITDFRYYDLIFTERMMKTPEENPEGYDNTNLNKMASNLKGKLLILCPEKTTNPTHTQQIQLFLDASKEVGTKPDYKKFPGTNASSNQIEKFKLIYGYFNYYLK
ncbi:dipeptidyl-peptidase-4 [Dysgonomonadaceae bacterium PH5-43]|nr:dipeptidyl-peptidase-4 [Dysgonomonadaceae bacterium PH5-43]